MNQASSNRAAELRAGFEQVHGHAGAGAGKSYRHAGSAAAAHHHAPVVGMGTIHDVQLPQESYEATEKFAGSSAAPMVSLRLRAKNAATFSTLPRFSAVSSLSSTRTSNIFSSCTTMRSTCNESSSLNRSS